jgi:spore coat protein CotH
MTHAQSVNHWETAVFNNDIWSYFAGTSEPDANWRSLSFDDSAWPRGPGGIGYGDNDDGTIISPCLSVFIRHNFNIADTAIIAEAVLSMDYDDAFVAYINDVEIARAGITGVHPAFNQLGADHEATMYSGGLPESFMIEKRLLRECLRTGDNVLSIQVHNSSTTSSDLSSNAFLTFGITNSSYSYRPVPAWFSAPMDFTSSNLPVVVITTYQGEAIVDEPKITADMKIIYHADGTKNYVADSGNVYTGKVGIEIRGVYSASLPQKPYGFETRDFAGNNLNVSLLGMPGENDWVLLANYNDKTFLRNVLAFDIFRKMGNYSTRMRFCEVVLNNEYQGIYLLGEKIKQDRGRVNIAKLKPDDNAGDNVTGGYIIKNDYYTTTDSWKSNFSPLNKPGAEVYYVYDDPKSEDLTEQQKNYIRGFINTLEGVLYSPFFTLPVFGYKSYIDIKSFADYFILGEVTRNVDTYKKSRYFYKNRDSKDGLLHSGPAWDFDWAWRNLLENCVHFNQTDGSGWAYKVNECDAWPVPPSWEVRMLQDTDFASLIHKRYFELRNTILSQSYTDNIIDSVANLLNEAQVRHFQKWNILGINTGTPESGPQPTTYSGEISQFKDWIKTRLEWLDANMIGSDMSGVKNPADYIKCRVFPNPASDLLFIESNMEIAGFDLYNISGIDVMKQEGPFNLSISVNLSHLPGGFYIVKIRLSDGEIVTTKVLRK